MTAQDVRAAGALLWRTAPRGLQVALVHRPKYDDWSWPKGKLEPEESWPGAAVREVLEETGLRVALGIPLPQASYEIGADDGSVRRKVVQYWAAQVVAGDGDLVNEVDEVAWLGPHDACTRLDYPRDRAQLRALMAVDRDGALDTWPLLVVRHARSVARARWEGEDSRRPLDGVGREHAAQLVPVLSAYGAQRLLSSDADRCAATVAPFARAAGVRLLRRHELSEEGFANEPDGTARALTEALDRAEPTALCTHRPVLPSVLGALADRAASRDVAAALRESSGPGLVKGEVLVAHLTGSGEHARVVAVERHDTR